MAKKTGQEKVDWLAVPQLIVNNWQSNNLQITNLSENKQVKVKVGLYGHGVPTYHLPIGPKVTLNQYQSCSGRTLANDMALRFTTQTQHQYTVMFLFTIGEPAAYCLNATDPDKIPKKGYPYITTSNNYKTIIQNWMGNPLFIINTSPAPGPVEVFLKGL